MPDSDAPAPGAGGDNAGPGRRRARLDHVGDELAALRRDLTTTRELLDSHAGHLAEALPRIDQLDKTVSGLVAVVTALTREQDDQAHEDVGELEARRAAGLADEPPAPWAWSAMDRPTAQAAWDALGRWVATVVCGQYRANLAVLPACWPAHSGAVAELTALRASHVSAHVRGARPAGGLSWAREFPAALGRVYGQHGAIQPVTCPPGGHAINPADAPTAREQQQVGRQPCSPDRWRPLLEQIAATDVAWRREPSKREPP